MKISLKITISSLILPYLMAISTVVGMEKKEKPQIEAILQLSNEISPAIHYADPLIHNLFKETSCPSNWKDPVVIIDFIQSETSQKSTRPVPAFLFFNCNDGSKIDIEYDSCKLKGTCQANPQRPGTFAIQFANDLNEHFKQPRFFGEDTTGLKNTGIINIKNRTTMLVLTGNEIESHTEVEIEHGPKGCSTEKIFHQDIFENSRNNTQRNPSMHNFVMGRQTGIKALPKANLLPVTPKLPKRPGANDRHSNECVLL